MMQRLLQSLVYDDKIEEMNGRYRILRHASHTAQNVKPDVDAPMGDDLFDEPEGNGLMDAPCGRCPVFDLCEDGGPVSASNCVYFDESPAPS